MKSDIHPKSHDVIFLDISSGAKFITQSTLKGEGTEKINGKEYSVVKVEISSDTHPFYTGKQKLMDTSGRVDKFNARRQKAQTIAAEAASAQEESTEEKTPKKSSKKDK